MVEGEVAMSSDGADRIVGDVSKRRARWSRWWLLVPALVVAWPAYSVTLRAASLRAFAIPTGSMAPTLVPGDRVLAETLPVPPPRRGEVWLFRMPKAASPAPSLAVKRVIGLPGESVEVASGRVLVDGRPLKEPYLAAAPAYTMPPKKLGPGEYFVLGDNRNASHDSHVWGPLPADHLVGRVKARYWPSGRMGGL
jgi:signal peptidase I